MNSTCPMNFFRTTDTTDTTDTTIWKPGLKPGFNIVVSVVSVVSVVRKQFIGQIEFILSRTYKLYQSFLLHRAFVRDVSIKMYLSYEFFSYDRHDR